MVGLLLLVVNLSFVVRWVVDYNFILFRKIRLNVAISVSCDERH